MTIREEMAQEREQDAIDDLADAKERIGQLEEDLRKSESTVRHARQWWATRFRRLEDFARQELGPELCTRFFSIVANGTAEPAEPPDYASQLNVLRLDLADMTTLAVDYKEANTRLEAEMRELLAKDDGRTREHNLLVQENRKLREALNAIAHHPGADSDRYELDSGEWRDALVQIARESLKPAK